MEVHKNCISIEIEAGEGSHSVLFFLGNIDYLKSNTYISYRKTNISHRKTKEGEEYKIGVVSLKDGGCFQIKNYEDFCELEKIYIDWCNGKWK